MEVETTLISMGKLAINTSIGVIVGIEGWGLHDTSGDNAVKSMYNLLTDFSSFTKFSRICLQCFFLEANFEQNSNKS